MKQVNEDVLTHDPPALACCCAQNQREAMGSGKFFLEVSTTDLGCHIPEAPPDADLRVLEDAAEQTCVGDDRPLPVKWWVRLLALHRDVFRRVALADSENSQALVQM